MYDIFPKNAELTKSQIEVLESEPNVIIYGPAGSGKTFLTILLAEKLKKFNPKATIQILVFTKALSKFILEALKIRNIKNVIVSHSTYYKDKVDYIILDEFQDFEIHTILKLKERVNVGMYLLGDLNQQIYSYFNNKKKLDKSILSVLGFKEINLQEVIRFNNNIYNFINDFHPLDSANKNTNNIEIKPKIFHCENGIERNSLIKELIDKNIENGDVGILLNDNTLVSEMVNYFKNNNIKLDGYKIKDEEFLNFGKSKVNILTYHSAKGLEFDTVILPYFGCDSYYGLDFYYTGLSRAKENFYILYSNNFPSFLKDINSTLYEGKLTKKPDFESALLNIEKYKAIYNMCKNDKFLSSILRENKLETINEIKLDLINQETDLSEKEIDLWINNEMSKVEKQN